VIHLEELLYDTRFCILEKTYSMILISILSMDDMIYPLFMMIVLVQSLCFMVIPSNDNISFVHCLSSVINRHNVFYPVFLMYLDPIPFVSTAGFGPLLELCQGNTICRICVYVSKLWYHWGET